jgi:AcrR family transcriptional regulator
MWKLETDRRPGEGETSSPEAGESHQSCDCPVTCAAYFIAHWCANNGVVPTESSRVRSMNETRDRILDVALDVLGENPDAGMGDIASAAGVVRRTVYGHFPSRLDLVRTLTERAVIEVTAVLTEVNASDAEADARLQAGCQTMSVAPITRRRTELMAGRLGDPRWLYPSRSGAHVVAEGVSPSLRSRASWLRMISSTFPWNSSNRRNSSSE